MREDIERSRRGDSSDIQDQRRPGCSIVDQCSKDGVWPRAAVQHLLVEGLSRKLERVTLVGIYDILERKNTFLGYKKQEVQKVIKLIFFQRG